MATATARGISMPSRLDVDGQVAYWVLGAIAVHNGDAPMYGWAPITTAEIFTWADDDWRALADDTAEIEGDISTAQRDRIRSELFDLERGDLTEAEPWWDR